MIRSSEIPLAILISGSGTTMKATIEAYKNGELTGIAPVAVIASRPDALGLAKAEYYGVRTMIVNPKELEMFADTAQDVQARLLPLEHQNVIQTLQMFADHGWMNGFHRDQPLIPPGKEHILYQAKDFACNVFPKG